MSWLRSAWGTLFRLFPSPAPLGLVPIGTPGRDSPVLVTCNFDLTVKRLHRALAGQDVWLLVSESKGVNVWCAAGAHELNADSVVAVVKTSAIADRVDHRTLVLPPLAAPGIRAGEVEKRTGWSVRWGPARAGDLPRYLAAGLERDEAMKRVTYDWAERLDSGLGSLFPFYALGGVGFLLFRRSLLLDYLAVGATTFTGFMLACPWLPGKTGLPKALSVSAVMGAGLLGAQVILPSVPARLRADLIIAMATTVLYGAELGGLSSTLPSDFDPLLARLGIKAIGNVTFAGTLRTDLLNGHRVLAANPDRCDGCGQCVEVCPLGLWTLDGQGHGRLIARDDCAACTACIVQCGSGAIKARKVASGRSTD